MRAGWQVLASEGSLPESIYPCILQGGRDVPPHLEDWLPVDQASQKQLAFSIRATAQRIVISENVVGLNKGCHSDTY